MSFLELPKLYHPDFVDPRKKPVGDVEVDWGNPIARGLRFMQIYGNHRFKDLVSGRLMESQGFLFERDSTGSHIKTDIYGGADFVAAPNFDISSWDGASLVALARRPSSANGGLIASVSSGAFTGNWLLANESDKVRVRFGFSNITQIDTEVMAYDALFYVAATHNMASGLSSMHYSIDNGGLVTNTDSNTPTFVGVADENYIGYYSRSGGRSWVRPIYYTMIFDRDITTEEAASIRANPYQLLKPKQPALYIVPSAAAVGTAVNAALESISLTSLPAVVGAGVNTDISAALESISLNAQSAVVQSDIDTVVSAEFESLILSPASATVQSNVDTAIDAGQSSILVTGNASVVQSNFDTGIGAALASIALTPAQAAVQTGFNTAINAAVEPISLSGLIAAVTADSSLAGTVESISLTASPAAIALGSALAASTESISLTGNTASITLGSIISAQLQSIVLTELASQINLSTDIDAAMHSLTITPAGAVVTLDSGITAVLESLTLSAFSATIVSPVSAITVPGLEYTIGNGLAHYTMPVNKLHFTFRS